VTAETPIWTRTAGALAVSTFATPLDLGRAAAWHTAEVIRSSVAQQGSARVVIATGNSQLAFVEALRGIGDIPWDAVTVFHMDEYVGITAQHPASFRRWIDERIGKPFRPAAVHYIDGDGSDPEVEARRYERLLREAPLDLVCMGIGENGHIAFNEPYQADFNDPLWTRVIALDERSRKQQVGEGHFPDIESVPERAISLTVPALLAPRHVQVAAPERRKAEAVRATLVDEISNACPATILRTQEHAVLFLDQESASLCSDGP
jgi:glucosamine-6-phosphate deaminase